MIVLSKADIYDPDDVVARYATAHGFVLTHVLQSFRILEKPAAPEQLMPLFGSDIYNKMNEKERVAMNVQAFAWTLSQFLHGEQGALLAAAQLVDSLQDLDS